ncbi:hypothetical protein SLEP1_g11511 [Rubroshorea leprosula]|uniref:Protein kinase domain-containing protein n=1 Tax=Rubroshorea leprosula TaxID=152421 RepID=A0AAV5IMA3_9ROSI|nr:hypothetical protein SLEP1_g11511 [Rubroshorea leprosula]
MAQMWFTGKMSTDIKCANILVDAYGSVKLADFGLAKVTKLNDVKSCKGTAFWMAPEVVNLKNQGYGPPADIWSLGCTVLEMLTRKIPYSPLEWVNRVKTELGIVLSCTGSIKHLFPSVSSVDCQPPP